jgi:hypothetical protein
MHHYFLQATRVPMRFRGFFPGSIFVYRLQKPTDPVYQFNLRDLPSALALAIQMGSVGILAALQDGGAQRDGFGSYLERYHRFPLHPIQFLELAASFFYKASLFSRVPKYLIIEGPKALEVIQLPLAGFSLKPVFEEWDQRTYAQVLAFHTGTRLQDVFSPPDRVMTWLNGPDGKPRFMSIRQFPWPEGPI